MPDKTDVRAFLCRGCNRPIDKRDVSVGHSDACPWWGSIENAHVDSGSLHELFRAESSVTDEILRLRAAAYDFANAILSVTPFSREQQTALRQLRSVLTMATSALPRAQAPPPEAPKKVSSRGTKVLSRRRKTGKGK